MNQERMDRSQDTRTEPNTLWTTYAPSQSKDEDDDCKIWSMSGPEVSETLPGPAYR